MTHWNMYSYAATKLTIRIPRRDCTRGGAVGRYVCVNWGPAYHSIVFYHRRSEISLSAAGGHTATAALCLSFATHTTADCILRSLSYLSPIPVAMRRTSRST
jgi:hypothetical protein